MRCWWEAPQVLVESPSGAGGKPLRCWLEAPQVLVGSPSGAPDRRITVGPQYLVSPNPTFQPSTGRSVPPVWAEETSVERGLMRCLFVHQLKDWWEARHVPCCWAGLVQVLLLTFQPDQIGFDASLHVHSSDMNLFSELLSLLHRKSGCRRSRVDLDFIPSVDPPLARQATPMDVKRRDFNLWHLCTCADDPPNICIQLMSPDITLGEPLPPVGAPLGVTDVTAAEQPHSPLFG
ncbi:unnamed protein product [Arctogadus glacialis]